MLYCGRRYLALARANRLLFARAFIWLAAMDIALRFTSFRWIVQRQQQVARTEGHTSRDAQSRAARYAHWIEIASRYHVVRARCLHRSLVLQHWLRREGLPSYLRIGVRLEGGVLHAHAWVELDGQAVNEHSSALATFVPLGQTHRRCSSSSDIYPGQPIMAAAGSTIGRRYEQGAWA